MRKSEAVKADLIPIPICCPECGQTALVCFPSVVVAMGLKVWNNMRLYSTCHDISWDAKPSELQRIRDYLGSEWLSLQDPHKL